ncbi:MAG: hypothetical protein LLG08_08925, partial [Actinomycetia bacterium]|nr:hypothetical protein [Actinomycetes bacterium]
MSDDIEVPSRLSTEQMKTLFGRKDEGEQGKDPSFADDLRGDGPPEEDFERDSGLGGMAAALTSEGGLNVPQNLQAKAEGISESAANVLGVNPDTKNPIVRPKRPDDPFVRTLPRSDKPAESKPGTIEELLAQIAKTSDFQPFDLPSGGLLDAANEKLSSGTVLIRPMRAAEEEILATGRLFRNGEGLEMIFRRCIMFGDRSPLEDPLQLLSLDRIAALIAIRIMTYGSTYDFSIVCGNCRKSFESEVDLDNDLDVHYLDPEQGLKEPMRSVFPECGLEFEYRLSRGYDEAENMKYSRERERK